MWECSLLHDDFAGGETSALAPWRMGQSAELDEEKDGLHFPGGELVNFTLPPLEMPGAFISRMKHNSAATSKLMNFKKGTTTLAFRFQGGIMVACDSRASQGAYIASQTVRKIIEINDYLLGTMAGGAADCSFWERYLGKLCRIHELRNGQRISVAHASKLLAAIFYNYAGYGLSCGTMIAGYDTKKNQTGLYMVDDSGMRTKGDLYSVGSGSLFAYGVLDTHYKWDLSVADAKELAQRAILQATHRDGASGGVVRVYHVHEKGWTKLEEGADVADLYPHYYPNN